MTPRRTLADWLRLVMLSAWTVAFAWLLFGHYLPGTGFTGAPYQDFIRAELWLLLAGGLALLLPVVVTASAQRSRPSGSAVSRIACTTLVLLPLLYLGMAPTAGLGAYALERRFLAGDAATFGGGPGLRRGKVPGDGKTTLLDVTVDPNAYLDQPVTLVGRLSKSGAWPDDHAMLFRFVVVCCAADARPVGVLVPQAALGEAVDDAWLEVSGTLRRASFAETAELVVDDADVRPIQRPANPYLYPF